MKLRSGGAECLKWGLLLAFCLGLCSCRAMAPANGEEGAPELEPEAMLSMEEGLSRIDQSERPAPAPSGGCSGAASALERGGTHERTLVHDGIERYARVYIPSSLSSQEPAPLVFMLHGGVGSGKQLETRSVEMNPIAEREGFVVVYPDGVVSDGLLKARTWNAGDCCGYAEESGADDVGFLLALLEELSGELCLDERRIYSSGMSNGAMMSYRLACEAPDRFAAIAPVAAQQVYFPCQAEREVAVLHIHGTDDPNAPYEGGQGCGLAGIVFPEAMEGLELWRGHNRCEGEEQHLFTMGNGQCDLLGACGAPVVRCLIDGGGHSWPGLTPARQILRRRCEGGEHSQSFIASEVIWRFFQGQARRD